MLTLCRCFDTSFFLKCVILDCYRDTLQRYVSSKRGVRLGELTPVCQEDGVEMSERGGNISELERYCPQGLDWELGVDALLLSNLL